VTVRSVGEGWTVLPRATTKVRERVLDKLGVTGSSPVPPIEAPAKRYLALPELLTESVSQVLVK